MIELAYINKRDGMADEVFTIIQFKGGKSFYFMPNGKLACKVEKQNGKWVQTDGELIEDILLQKIAAFVEAHNAAADDHLGL